MNSPEASRRQSDYPTPELYAALHDATKCVDLIRSLARPIAEGRRDETRIARDASFILELSKDAVSSLRGVLHRSRTHETNHGETAVIRDVVERSTRMLGSLHDHLEFRVEIDAEAGKIETNPGIESVFRELLDNAILASRPGGEVASRVELRDSCLVISVRDQGQGMSPDQLLRCGELGFTTKRNARGCGIGIAKSRELVEKLKGRLVLESERGRGTVARIELPI